MPKSRRVSVTLEIETDRPLPELRRARTFDIFLRPRGLKVLQASVHVVDPKDRRARG